MQQVQIMGPTGTQVQSVAGYGVPKSVGGPSITGYPSGPISLSAVPIVGSGPTSASASASAPGLAPVTNKAPLGDAEFLSQLLRTAGVPSRPSAPPGSGPGAGSSGSTQN